MTARETRQPSVGTRRVERFFVCVGVVLTSLLVTAALVNVASFVLLRLHESAGGGRVARRREALIAQLGRPRGAGVGLQSPLLDMMSASPVYDPYPWAEEFWREERTSFPKTCYAPYRLWTHCGPHRGKFVRIGEDGFRISPDALGPAGTDDEFNVFVMGGSAAYGAGSPDSETLTAHLAAVLRERLEKSGPRPNVRVVNLGVPAYNSTQELLLLIELLKRGHRPDLVVFYGGANDATVGPGLHWDYEGIRDKLEGSQRPTPPLTALLQSTSTYRLASGVRKRLAGGASDSRDAAGRAQAPDAQPADEPLRARARATLDNWLSDRKIVAALAEGYSFRYLHVWQPAFFYGNKPLSPSEQVLAEHPELFSIHNLDANAGRAFVRSVRAVYEEAERRAAVEDFLFLADAFDRTPEPVYVDWVHTGPRGNRLVAERIADRLEARRLPPFAEGR